MSLQIETDSEWNPYAKLEAENAALKQQVDNLLALWKISHTERSEAMLQLTTLQSKSTALVDALERARNRIKGLSQAAFGFGNEDSCSYIDAALAAFKGETCDVISKER